MRIMDILGSLETPKVETVDKPVPVSGNVLIECYQLEIECERELQKVLTEESLLEAADTKIEKVKKFIKTVVAKMIAIMKKVGSIIINYIPDILKTYILLADRNFGLKVTRWLRSKFRLRQETAIAAKMILSVIHAYRSLVEKTTVSLVKAVAPVMKSDMDFIDILNIKKSFSDLSKQFKPEVIPFNVSEVIADPYELKDGMQSIIIATLSKSEITMVYKALDYPDTTKEVFNGIEKTMSDSAKKMSEDKDIDPNMINKWYTKCTTKLKEFIQMITTITKFFGDIIKSKKTTMKIVNTEYKKEESTNE